MPEIITEKSYSPTLKLVLTAVIASAITYVFILLSRLNSSVNITQIIFAVMGGLALLLLGMEFLSQGLRQLAGNKLKYILQKLTKNSLLGVLLGTAATGILQSSSATTVMVVGFVNTGLMQLHSAVSVIMGANIGTTVTGQIIAFNVGQFALPILAIGIFMFIFSRKEQIKFFGQTLAGVGLVFFGISLMKNELSLLSGVDSFKNLLVTFSAHPIMAVFVGALFTLVIQSSSATIGIIIALAAAKAITIESAIPLILGLNIGTTITANFAALNASPNAKRAARIHFVFNALGTLVFLIFLPQFDQFMKYISGDASVARQVANAHSIFNLVSTIIFLPFITLLVKLSFYIIPKTPREKELSYLDPLSLSSPSIACDHVKQAILHMHSVTLNTLKTMQKYIFDQDEEKGYSILDEEEQLDYYQSKVLDYMTELTKSRLNTKESNRVTRYMHVINHLEQIGDYYRVIQEIVVKMRIKDIHFSEQQRKDLSKALKQLAKFVVKNRMVIIHESKTTYAKALKSYDGWHTLKHDALLRNRVRATYKSENLVRINYFVDILLALQDIAKKNKHIATEAVDDLQ